MKTEEEKTPSGSQRTNSEGHKIESINNIQSSDDGFKQEKFVSAISNIRMTTKGSSQVPAEQPSLENAYGMTKWFEKDLAKSGISLELAADLDIASVHHEEFFSIIGFKPNTRGMPVAGYKIPFKNPDGSPVLTPDGNFYARVRLQHPHFNREGKPVRYLAPISSGIYPYIISPVHKFLMDNPRFPLVLTEGEKKIICAWYCNKTPVIGISGIWGWLESKHVRDELGEPDLINAGLARYLNGQRGCVIIFDSDCTEPEKAASFDICAFRLARELKIKFNTQLLRINLPADDSGEKIGLDDYIMKNNNRLLLEVLFGQQ